MKFCTAQPKKKLVLVSKTLKHSVGHKVIKRVEPSCASYPQNPYQQFNSKVRHKKKQRYMCIIRRRKKTISKHRKNNLPTSSFSYGCCVYSMFDCYIPSDNEGPKLSDSNVSELVSRTCHWNSCSELCNDNA